MGERLTKPTEPYFSYGVKIKVVGIEAPFWSWQVDGEPGNGVFGQGFAHTRIKAVRAARRCMRAHARRRKNRNDWWWMEPAPERGEGE